MATSGVGSTSDTTVIGDTGKTPTAASGLDNVNFDTFLKLLVAQLKNQDPLNPMDGTQFTGQIAQFSQLEQQQKSNSYLQQLLQQRDYGQQALASSYLGKQVLGPGNTMIKDGDTVGFGYTISATAKTVDISIISNETGKTIRTIAGDGTTGSHIAGWDGKDDNGDAAPNGAYTIKVSAADADGKTVVSQALTFGTVASVLNDSSSSYVLLTDDRQIAVSDILAVRETAAATPDTPTDTPAGDTGTDTSGGDTQDQTASN